MLRPVSGLDGEEEFIVYAAPVGTVRPEDTAQEMAFYQFVEDVEFIRKLGIILLFGWSFHKKIDHRLPEKQPVIF